MASGNVAGFSHSALLVFSFAGVFLTVLGFWFSSLFIALSGAVLLLVYLGLGIILSSHQRFKTAFSSFQVNLRTGSEKSPVQLYLVSMLEVELSMLLLGAAALLLARFFLPRFFPFF